MRNLKINIPDSLNIKDLDLMMIIASKLYEDKKLSSGQAAKVAGLSKKTFIELLGKYGVSIFGNANDLQSDILNA